MRDVQDVDYVEEELPDEERERRRVAEEQRIEKLNAFAQSLVKRRHEAIAGRAASGIEQQWTEDGEFYEGIDDANREDLTIKPTSSDGGASTRNRPSATRSNVFLNITRPYVDMASARVADMLLPTDDRAWSLRPTPMPDIVGAAKDQTLLNIDGDQVVAGDIAKKMLEKAKTKADKAEKRIEDWHVECQWHGEIRKIIEDAARLGTAVLKGPFPVKRKGRSLNLSNGTAVLEIFEEIKPASKRVDPWNFYPDPLCGESIHNGSYTWEKDNITARQLRDLIGLPGYLESEIEKVLEEGPQKKNEGQGEKVGDGEKFQIWYYHGVADHEDLMAAGCKCEEGKVIPVIVTMVNDRVIKAAMSPLDSGEFPYDVMIWQRQTGKWTGIGVGRQVRTPQRMINAGTRNMMDNAGLSAGPQIVIRRGVLLPADGSYEITPRKVWYVSEGADIQQVAHAIHSINIESRQQELMEIIQFALKMAEEVTGMPLLMQGQQGQATDTVGGMTMLQNNSSTVLRRIAKVFDDMITEPHIRRYYEWLLIYGTEEDEKGDFVIDARGSSALFERDAQNQAILQMGALVKDPAFKINPEKWFAEALKAQRLDPSRFQYTDEEWEEIQARMAENPPPADPRLEAAKINADASIKREEIKGEIALQKAEMDTDRDSVYVQAEQERTLIMHEAKMTELEQRERLAMLEYANREKITLEQVKAGLASDAMKLRVQKELAMTPPAGAPQVATPPTEPKGRAPDGQAFQK